MSKESTLVVDFLFKKLVSQGELKPDAYREFMRLCLKGKIETIADVIRVNQIVETINAE